VVERAEGQAGPGPVADKQRLEAALARHAIDPPEWTEVSIDVDGRSARFEMLAGGRFWVARAELPDVVVGNGS
jgi:hypothetical protein